MTSGFILIKIFPHWLIKLFGKQNTELLAPGVDALNIFFLMTPIIGFQIVISGFFQATGKPGKALLMSLSRQVIFLIPFVIIFPLFFGLNGVWAAAPASDFIASIIAVSVFYA